LIREAANSNHTIIQRPEAARLERPMSPYWSGALAMNPGNEQADSIPIAAPKPAALEITRDIDDDNALVAADEE
jgi:hypothetical protein